MASTEGYLFYIYIAFCITAVIFSILVNGLFLRFSRTMGVRGNADDTVIRWGIQSKPAIGGISFYILFLLSIVSYSVFIDPNRFLLKREFAGLLIAVNMGFLMGLADDAYNTNPLLKFLIQLGCGIALIVSGTCINLFPYALLNYAITLFWVIGIMNAINMLDNMDGIIALVSLAIITGALFYLSHENDYTNVNFIILLGIACALIGFLFFNWHPSRIYMGDTGSQFLGAFLAAIGIVYFWNRPLGTDPENIFLPAGRRILVTVLMFLLPIVDTTIVVINRMSKGRSPFIGGKDHTTHGLAYLGLSDRMVAVVCAAVSFVSVYFSYLIEFTLRNTWNLTYALLFSSYIATVFVLLLLLTRRAMNRLIS